MTEEVQMLGQDIIKCYNKCQELQEKSYKNGESENMYSEVSGYLLLAVDKLK
jgi:hypothetical protein